MAKGECVEVVEVIYGNNKSAKIALYDSGAIPETGVENGKGKPLKHFGKFDEKACEGVTTKRVFGGFHKAVLNRGEGAAVTAYWLTQLASIQA